MPIDDGLYEIPENFCMNGLGFHVSNIEKNLLTKLLLLRTLVRVEVNVENL